MGRAFVDNRGGNAMSGLLLLHVSLVGLSLLLFIWRGLRMWVENPIVGRVARRVLPDTVDTLLLISGITLAYSMQFAPWQDSWLAAKLLALFLYIVFGFIALDRPVSLWIKRSSFLIALLTVLYIVAVAHTMQAVPWS